MSGLPIRATWWTQAAKAQNYVRAELPARYLPGQCLNLEDWVDVQADPWVLDRDPTAYWFPRQKGPAIWLFSGNNTRAVLMKAMQLKGIPVFFECDDDYTIAPDVAVSKDWTLKRTGTDVASFETACDIARFSDGVICATPRLADVYSDLNGNVHVCRNAVDPDDWAPLDKPDDGVLRVGWAASDSHLHDAPLLDEAFRWLAYRPDVEIVVIGIQSASFPTPVVRIPWVDSLADYRRLLQTIDVMLCPLQRTAWADSKSDLKALDAAMAGAMSVVADSPAYAPWHERTIVCVDERDWRKAVKHLYRHRDEVRELQAAHRDYVLSERTIQTGVDQWRTALSLSKTTPAVPSRSAAAGSAT